MRYLLPASTARLVESHPNVCRNLGLILDKFVPEEAIGKSEGKGRWLKELVSSSPNALERLVDMRLWEERYQRWLALTQAAGAVTFQAKLAWRMVVGLGGQSVLETDLTLDHLSGLPIIPGSALKGLTRSYAAIEIYHSPAKKPEEDHKEIKRIFGVQEKELQQAGMVIFFDALPVPPRHAPGLLRFVVDIMNPHYPAYYQENGAAPPSNDQSPVPVTFLTVEGATFAFAVAPRSGVVQQVPEGNETDLARAVKWLKEALQHYGVGGKTSAGYGVFAVSEDTSQTTPRVQPAALSAQPCMTREEAEARIQGKTRLGNGIVQKRTEEEAIIKFQDPKIGLLGLIPKENFGGRALNQRDTIPTCDVIGLIQRDGGWFILLKCPPK